MSADEFEAIPEDEWKALATTEITHLTDEEKDYLPHAWDKWITRVRRDAAADAEHAARLARDRAYKADIAWEDEKRRADQAEARIKAVYELLDENPAAYATVYSHTIRRALDG